MTKFITSEGLEPLFYVMSLNAVTMRQLKHSCLCVVDYVTLHKNNFVLINFCQVNTLQFENDNLRKRVAELEKLKDRSDVEAYKRNNQVTKRHFF